MRWFPNLFFIDRTKRIRDAKAEAQKEIEEYRSQKEEEYKKFEAEVRSIPGRNIVSVSVVLTDMIWHYSALQWIQEGGRRCQQGGRGEAEGDPGRWQGAGRQGRGRPDQSHNPCQARGSGEDCEGIDLTISGLFAFLWLSLDDAISAVHRYPTFEIYEFLYWVLSLLGSVAMSL